MGEGAHNKLVKTNYRLGQEYCNGERGAPQYAKALSEISLRYKKARVERKERIPDQGNPKRRGSKPKRSALPLGDFADQ